MEQRVPLVEMKPNSVIQVTSIVVAAPVVEEMHFQFAQVMRLNPTSLRRSLRFQLG